MPCIRACLHSFIYSFLAFLALGGNDVVTYGLVFSVLHSSKISFFSMQITNSKDDLPPWCMDDARRKRKVDLNLKLK